MGLRIGKRKFDNRKTWAIFIIGGLLWIGLIFLMGFFNMREGDRKVGEEKSGAVSLTKNGTIDSSSNKEEFSGIAIFAKVSIIDVNAFTYSIHFTHFPRGNVIDNTGIMLYISHDSFRSAGKKYPKSANNHQLWKYKHQFPTRKRDAASGYCLYD
jgi:hypothetical protein